jgi:hypothetical protein
MATFVPFAGFLWGLGKKEHDLSADTLKVYLSNEAPLTSDTNKADIAEIAEGNGYTAGGNTLIMKFWTKSTNAATFASATDPSWMASGGSIGPFRYAILYNDTHASDRLIGYWDRGSSMTLADGETFTLTLGNIFTIS